MRRLSFLFLLAVGLVLAACSSVTPSPTAQPADEASASLPTQPRVMPTQTSAAQPVQPAGAPVPQLAEQTDSQGAVTVIVKPLGLNSSQDTLNFEVSLDTHSVDLNMDLAVLATLSTDSGQGVNASMWDAPRGGHHVSGTLSFPATIEGGALLDGASKLTLIIKDIDTAERVFTWDLR